MIGDSQYGRTLFGSSGIITYPSGSTIPSGTVLPGRVLFPAGTTFTGGYTTSTGTVVAGPVTISAAITLDAYTTLNGDVILPVIETETLELSYYSIGISNAAGDFLGLLPDYTTGSHKQVVNEPSILTLEYPINGSSAELIQGRCLLHVWDGAGNLVDVVRIGCIERDFVSIKITAYGLLDELTNQSPSAIKTDTMTLSDAVEYVISQQSQSPKVELGEMDQMLAQSIVDVKAGSTLREILDNLQEQAGGWITIDPSTGNIHWKTVYDSPILQLLVNKNITGISIKENHRNIATVLTATTANNAKEIVEVVGPTRNIYGVIRKQLNNTTIADKGKLEKWLTEQAAILAYPEKSVQTSAIDLSQIEGIAIADMQRIALGNPVLIVVPDLDIQKRSYITSISRNLSNPAAVSIEVSEPDIVEESESTESDAGTGSLNKARKSATSVKKDAARIIADAIKQISSLNKTVIDPYEAINDVFFEPVNPDDKKSSDEDEGIYISTPSSTIYGEGAHVPKKGSLLDPDFSGGLFALDGVLGLALKNQLKSIQLHDKQIKKQGAQFAKQQKQTVKQIDGAVSQAVQSVRVLPYYVDFES